MAMWSFCEKIVNEHKCTGNTLFHQCGHRQISSSEAKNTCWLKPGSPAHLALDEVVLNTKLLKDLAKLTDFSILVIWRCITPWCWILLKTRTFFVQRSGCQNTTCRLGQQWQSWKTTSCGAVRWTRWSRKVQGLLSKGLQTLGCEAYKSKKNLTSTCQPSLHKFLSSVKLVMLLQTKWLFYSPS